MALEPTTGGGIGGRLSQKIGPLPLWGWGAAAVAVAGAYFWYTRRSSGGSSSSSSTDTSGTDTSGDYSPQTFSSGYDSGYAAGLNATGNPYTAASSSGTGSTTSTDPTGTGSGSGSGAVAPASHNRFCAKTKDPSGKMVTACGYGTWLKSGTGWKWQPGIPPASAISASTGASSSSPAAGGSTATAPRNPQTGVNVLPLSTQAAPSQQGGVIVSRLGSIPTGQQVAYATV